MGLNTYEISDHDGSPVELYVFETDDLLHRWTYTTDVKPKTVGLYTYTPEAISRSGLKQNASENGSERLTITVPWNNPVAVLHVPYLPPRPVRVRVYRYQRRDVGEELIQGFIGYITNFAQKGPLFEFYCSQIIDTMQQSVPWAVFKAGCIWTTYSAECGANRSDFLTVVNDLSLIDGDALQSNIIDSLPDTWFRGGYAENEATGEIRFITEHIGNQVLLVHPFTDITLATVLKFYAGDDQLPETCRLKFNRKTSYTGFDHFPAFNVFVQGTK